MKGTYYYSLIQVLDFRPCPRIHNHTMGRPRLRISRPAFWIRGGDVDGENTAKWGVGQGARNPRG